MKIRYLYKVSDYYYNNSDVAIGVYQCKLNWIENCTVEYRATEAILKVYTVWCIKMLLKGTAVRYNGVVDIFYIIILSNPAVYVALIFCMIIYQYWTWER